LTIYFPQGSVATDFRGGASFNFVFLNISSLNLTVKNYKRWSTFVDVIAKIKVTHFIETPSIYLYTTTLRSAWYARK